MKKTKYVVLGIASLCGLGVSIAQTDKQESLLSVKEIMNAMITPATTTIWGAYQLETEAQWQEVNNAALSVIAAGNLLQLGRTGAGEAQRAQEADWLQHSQLMIDAARRVIAAVQNKDEEALSAALDNE